MGVRIIGLKKANRTLKILNTEIPNSMVKQTKKELSELRDIISGKISKFSFTGTLANKQNWPIETINKSQNTSSIRLRSTTPYAVMVEEGVKPHWVYTLDKPLLQEWMRKKYPGDPNRAFIYIGGSRSHIQKNNSKNKFFEPTIDQYISSKRYISNFRRELHNALKKATGGK